MIFFSKLIFAFALAIIVAAPVCAQNDHDPYEFGFWSGFSPKATTIFGSLPDDEAEDHISNGDRQGSNRGLNHFVIYAGFSVFK